MLGQMNCPILHKDAWEMFQNFGEKFIQMVPHRESYVGKSCCQWSSVIYNFDERKIKTVIMKVDNYLIRYHIESYNIFYWRKTDRADMRLIRVSDVKFESSYRPIGDSQQRKRSVTVSLHTI